MEISLPRPSSADSRKNIHHMSSNQMIKVLCPDLCSKDEEPKEVKKERRRIRWNASDSWRLCAALGSKKLQDTEDGSGDDKDDPKVILSSRVHHHQWMFGGNEMKRLLHQEKIVTARGPRIHVTEPNSSNKHSSMLKNELDLPMLKRVEGCRSLMESSISLAPPPLHIRDDSLRTGRRIIDPTHALPAGIRVRRRRPKPQENVICPITGRVLIYANVVYSYTAIAYGDLPLQ